MSIGLLTIRLTQNLPDVTSATRKTPYGYYSDVIDPLDLKEFDDDDVDNYNYNLVVFFQIA